MHYEQVRGHGVEYEGKVWSAGGDTALSLVEGWVICQWGNFDSANVDVQTNKRPARDVQLLKPVIGLNRFHYCLRSKQTQVVDG